MIQKQSMPAAIIYILYFCNEWKEWSSMRLVMATTEPDKIRKALQKLIRRRDVEYGGQPGDIADLELSSLNSCLSHAYISTHDDGALEI